MAGKNISACCSNGSQTDWFTEDWDSIGREYFCVYTLKGRDIRYRKLHRFRFGFRSVGNGQWIVVSCYPILY